MNKKQAAEYLGVSTRAVERYTAKGKLTPTYEKGRTGPAPVYSTSQLDELKKEMDAAIAIPRSVGEADKPVKRDRIDKSDGLMLRSNKSNDLAMLLAVLDRSRTSSALDVSAKLLLSINECQKLTGLSNSYLRKAIHTGKLKGKIIGRGYKVKRADLNAYVRKI